MLKPIYIYIYTYISDPYVCCNMVSKIRQEHSHIIRNSLWYVVRVQVRGMRHEKNLGTCGGIELLLLWSRVTY